MNNIIIKNNDITIQGDISVEKLDKKGFDNSIKILIQGEQDIGLGFNISSAIHQRIFIELFLTKNSKLNLKTVCCGCFNGSSHFAMFSVIMGDGSSLNWIKSYNWSFTKVKDKIFLKMFNNSKLNIEFSGSLENAEVKEDFKLNILGQNNEVKIFTKQLLKNSKSKIIERLKIKGDKNKLETKAKVGLETSKSYIFMFSKTTGKMNVVSSICEEVFLNEDSIAKSLPLIYSSHGSNKIDHEAKIGEVEKEKLYYLINRGISPEKAKMLII